MINFNTIEEKVIQNKILISNEDMSIEYKPIVFFIYNDEIVYIGKTDKKISEYIMEKSHQFKSTYYYTELVCIDEVDNIMAELILKIQPSSNQRVPNNTKYITNTKAKELYHINKNEFKRYWNENEGLKFRKTLFLEKKIFDDIFAIPNPYCKNMPKVGTLINSIEDVNNTPIDLNLIGESCSREEMDNGRSIVKIETFRREIPVKENYKNLQLRFKHAYQVTCILNHNTFEVYSTYKNEYKKFKTDEKNWEKFPTKYEESINYYYFESLNS